jgi:valyl-tRNA synthetase
MVMMGLELTDKLPFTDVFLHTLVRDKNGRKMSKSLGNVLDPLWVVYGATLDELKNSLKGGNLPQAEVEIAQGLQEKDFPNGIAPCGSDGLRYALLFNTKMGSDTNLDINVVVTFQQFAQKVWQASSGIVLPYISGYTPKPAPMEDVDAPLVCKWALHQLDTVVEKVNSKLEEYSFADAAMAPFKFFQDEFCGIFIEHIKQMNIKDLPNGDATKEAVQEAIYTLLETQLRLLHPFMPFATEEIWQRLPKRANVAAKSIMIAPYPAADASWRNNLAHMDFNIVHNVVTGLRKMKSDAKLNLKDKPGAFFRSADQATCQLLESMAGPINGIVGCTLKRLSADAKPPAGPSAVAGNVTVHMDLAGLVDLDAELKKLQDELAKKVAAVKKIADQQAGEHYHKKPEAKREQDTVKKAGLEAEVAQLQKAVQEMQGAVGSSGSSSPFNMWYASKCM